MKKLIFTACVALMAGSGVAQTFEGRIAMSTVNTLNDEKAEVSWLLRKGESRMDFVSVAKGVSTDYALIVDANGIDMVAKGQVTKVPTNAIPAGNYQLMERAGEETINGFNCTHYVFTDGSSSIDIWASTEVGVSLSDMPFLMRAKFPAGDQFKGFPIRFEKRDLMGKLLQSHDVRSIQAEAVPASAFVRK